MTRTVRAFAPLTCLACLGLAAFSQSPSAPAPQSNVAPEFVAADIHTSPHSNTPQIRGGDLRGDRYVLRDATMANLIATAYDVETANVLSGPAWLDLERFDILAKAPRNTSPETIKLMLRALLTDRFQLTLHTGTKPLPAFVLSPGKGAPKMKQADAGGQPGCEFHPPAKDAPPAVIGNISFSCHNQTMAAFAQFLRQDASPYLRKPVVDATGLKGGWDFDIYWAYQPPKEGTDGITIFDAVEKQLGLKLDAANAPLPAVIVDSVNEKPTPNAPGLDRILPPPPPAEFEVAVIKPSPPGPGVNLSINNGQVEVHGASLQFMITWAWDINTQMIADAPKWLDDSRFDILGKASTDPAISAQIIDLDDLRQMLRSLLADRFKMKSHMEDRPGDAYTLTAVHPKLNKADPLNRTGCRTGPGADGKDPRIANPILGRLVSCQNMTMKQFADQLQSMASGYIKSPVFDATGIDGAYDFTLSFSTSAQLRSTAQASSGDDSAANSASVPTGGLTLFDAINRQLGLKLAPEKHPIPMLVIDHIEEKPTDN